MKCVFLVFFHVLLLTTTVLGQTMVKGYIVGSKSEPLVGASVILLRKSDSSVVKGTVSTRSGEFNLHGISNGMYLLKVNYIGYKNSIKAIVINNASEKTVGKILLAESNLELSDFVFKEKAIIAEQKGDTTEFNASAVKVNQDAVAEDLVAKLPGVTIENGTVKAQGEAIQQVLVDNVEFFGNDASIALKNLPADMIDRVQLYDKQSEEAQFTGFKDGETSKTLNIKTKKSKSYGLFGNLQMGYATDQKYRLNGNLNLFKGLRRISIVGGSNNINEQNFSAQDVLGLGKMGGRPQGMQGGGAQQSMLGQNDGINTNHNLGVNYSDQWGKRWTASGSYFVNQTNNQTSKQTDRTYLLNDSVNQYYTNKSLTNTENLNHRFNARLECKIDSTSNLLIMPSFSFQKNMANSSSYEQIFNEQKVSVQSNPSVEQSNNEGFSANNSAYYRKKFQKKGRSLFVDFTQALSHKTGNSTLLSSLSNQQSETSNNDLVLNSRISYTEPLGKFSLLKFNFAPSVKQEENTNSTSSFNSTSNEYVLNNNLSSNYRLKTNKQQGGLAFLFKKKKVNLNVGTDFQSTLLHGEEILKSETVVNKHFERFLIRSDLFYTLNKRTNFHLGYNTESTNPSANQLQTIINNSNEFYQTQGNANLTQQYTHELRCMYRTVDYTLTRSFFMAAHASLSNNYIGNTSYIANTDTLIQGVSLASGAQLSSPENLSGYINIDGFTAYSFPVYFIKSNINLGAAYGFTQLPGLINNLKNYASTNKLSGSIGLVSNISENIDFNLSYQANYNWIENSLQSQQNQNYYAGLATGKVNLSHWSHWVLSTDANLNHYIGLGTEYDSPFILWNAAIAYKFLKNNAAEIKLTVYDLLNQNKSISRTVNDTYIEDVQNQVLKQYFMLQLSFRLREFKS